MEIDYIKQLFIKNQIYLQNYHIPEFNKLKDLCEKLLEGCRVLNEMRNT